MHEILSEYIKEVDSVLEENPILRLEKLLTEHQNITAGEITQLSIRIKQQWNEYAKSGLEMCIVLTEEECDGKELIYKYNFADDISEVVQSGKKRSKIYYLNAQNKVSKIKESEERLTAEQCSLISKDIKKIVLHLGIKGIDIFVDGVIFKADNFIKSYKDLMNIRSMLSINDYGKLLKGFFEKNIQYDLNQRYFVRKEDIPTEYHSKTVEKYDKLLRNRPEQFFHMDFVNYLKDNCRDIVITEYRTITKDRYDVLVLSEENQGYVFEIKWLGRSVTTGMKVFDKYNNDVRAIEGAYQILDYVTNADKYKEYFLEIPVCCAILLIFDARDSDTDIIYPKEILGHSNLDLSRKFFMEKKKISASNLYSSKRR